MESPLHHAMTQPNRQPVFQASEPLPQRIAILRALQLGDLLCLVPALRALRAALPEAQVVLLGLPWARALVARFPHYLDDFLEFPGYPGLPEQSPAPERLGPFLHQVQSRRFDLVLQMHGCGTITNPLAVLCGGRRTAGFYVPGQYCPDQRNFLPYPAGDPEIWRHLRLLELLGIPPQGDQLEFPVRVEDDAALDAVAGAQELRGQPYVCIHAGARAAERRWPLERFAALAEALAGRGLRIVLTGSREDRELTHRLVRAMRARALDLAGQTSIGALAALLSGSRLLVCNDTGVSHLAGALRVPSVVVFMRPESQGWPPLERVRHRVVCHFTEPPVAAVLDQALDLIHASPADWFAVHGPGAACGEEYPSHRRCRTGHEQRLRGAHTLMRPLRILTWHIHGSYLYYLAHVPHQFYLPVKAGRPEGYGGRTASYPWPENVLEVPAEEVRRLELDCILFQSRQNYLEDQYEILSAAQRRLPRIYLEHDPPRQHPTDTQHPVDDPEILLVHVTPFNDLMWDSGRTPTCVIEHGVCVPPRVQYTGELARGIVVVNNLRKRGRRLGADLFHRARRRVPLDLVGMGWQAADGLREIRHADLPAFACRYRFFFNPIRYTSLGLAVCEAMMLGMPIIGLATTEMATAIENGVSGYVDTRIDSLIERMQELLASLDRALDLGQGARRRALERFSLERFVQDWNRTLTQVAGVRTLAPLSDNSAWRQTAPEATPEPQRVEGTA
jgi:ADP-heptose:LPS heptosyltransferase